MVLPLKLDLAGIVDDGSDPILNFHVNLSLREADSEAPIQEHLADRRQTRPPYHLCPLLKPLP